MRTLVVLLPFLLLVLAFPVDVVLADGDVDGKEGKGNNGSSNGVGPVKNQHCPKLGRGPDPHGDDTTTVVFSNNVFSSTIIIGV
ncbi:hypothetical protein GUJ93_ZPchr0006g46137 [Zizania palustris]|uniref:Uncharacterized protein n=1 Tax=Zizania palustris TaxID=103762 RepID=A0A8J5TB84_ZIZPA|nr:hypothetical protein GUJ93_ZPchr0006g46137 [Zizania palustris]